MGGWVESMSKRDTVSSLPSHFKLESDFLYSVVNNSDFANNPNKDEIKELLQPRSPAFGRGVHSICLSATPPPPYAPAGDIYF
jgi:hypothetical protein